MFNLRPYQIEAVDAIMKSIDGEIKGLVVMATGLGKTVVFAEVINRLWLEKRNSLVLAHREELINQAIDKIYRQTKIVPEKEMAADWASKDAHAVVASVPTLQGARLSTWLPEYFDFITVDEAHHSVAKSYRSILDYFKEYSLLGVTATPDRADQKALGTIYDEVIYSYSLPHAIKDGWLSPIIGRRVKDFEIDLTELRVVAGDYLDKDLGEVIEKFIAPIAYNIAEHTKDRKTLIFCPNVNSSKLMAEALQSLGVSADFVSGKHDMKDRDRILSNLHRSVVTHICSCNILLEGFDEPSVDAVVMLRPTTSRSLYAQAIGRGTRLHNGKDNLLLLEFTFNSDRLNLVQPYELFSEIGFGDAVRRRARNAETDGYIDYLSALEDAAIRQKSISDIMSRLTIRKFGFDTFDPFALADLSGCDISGEFDINYKGHKISGEITDKQKELLKRYGIIDYSGIDKAKASILISSFFNNKWIPYTGFASDKQMLYLRKNGYSYPYMTKALASIIITRIKEEKAAGTWVRPDNLSDKVSDNPIDLNWLKEKAKRMI